MFFMGEEVGTSNPFTVFTFAANKVDLIGQSTGDGKFLFRFYQDLIHFVLGNAAARSSALDVIYTHNDNRVIAFTRSAQGQKLLVLASLSDSAFASGYAIATDPSRLPAGGWRETFNSDASAYGGDNVGNYGAAIPVNNGQIYAIIPARGFAVFEKIS
jgi:1,4-alpha-glucan branching enzyme